MIEKFFVTIICWKEENNKFDQYEVECVDMVDVSRVLMTYKPKRGYDMVNVNIDKWVGLV